ncbi:MAG TPA: branched-chain amino acid ABC transporter permease [Streptosporangiaceae bacterium]|jgi:neutral amino acid transport system permease protein|nr:branched-chain amino acid ABC transporter permease [Streptosporangiaceae bacterium]
MSNFLLGVGFGLVTASILALATVPLSLQMSVARIPNFAHGEILTAGAYAAYVVNEHTDNIYLESVAAALAGGVVAYLMNALLLQPFARRKPKLLILFILTIAASLIVQNVILFFFTGNSLAFKMPASPPHHIGPFLLTGMNLFTIGAAVVVMAAVHVVLKYTKFGKAQRAVADSGDLARITGINSERIVRLTWLIDGLIAGFAGFLLGVSSGTLTPTVGQGYLLVIFAAAILGGIGRPYGAMAGALVIGLAMEISALYIPADYKEAVAFGLLVLTLLLRPSGIFAAPRSSGAAGATA